MVMDITYIPLGTALSVADGVQVVLTEVTTAVAADDEPSLKTFDWKSIK